MRADASEATASTKYWSNCMMHYINVLYLIQPSGSSSSGSIDWYCLANFLHSCATALKLGLGPRRATLRPVFMRASSPMTKRASSNRARLFCAVCASFGTTSLRKISTDSMLSDSLPSRISTRKKLDDLRVGKCIRKRKTYLMLLRRKRQLLSKERTQQARSS